VRIFGVKGAVIDEATEEHFTLERDIQHLIEQNLEKVLRIKFVRSEFSLHGLRIDTLAFDDESKSFVVIEYKRERNTSVVDQGLAYLYQMLNNKSDFILEYNEKFTPGLKRDDIDWSQSKVIFVSTEFTKHQQFAVGYKDFAVELWEVHKYTNGILVFNKLEQPETKESITAIAKASPAAQKVRQEIRVYDEDYHVSHLDEKMRNLYAKLSSGIRELGSDIEVKPKKPYVGFWRGQDLFATVKFPKGKLRIKLNLDISKLKDQAKLAKPRKSGGSIIYCADDDKIPYVIELLKQSYEKSR
jgi:predicted transport protein